MQNASGIQAISSHLFVGHRHAVSTITINKNYGIAVSTDVAGVAILWDMNKQIYVRTILEANSSSVVQSCISNTLGDIALITHNLQSQIVLGSQLKVFTINGQVVGSVATSKTRPYFTSVCYSTATEGQSINVIATGLSNGAIQLWSSWNLVAVREIKINRVQIPVKR